MSSARRCAICGAERRDAMQTLARDLRAFADQLVRLAEVAPWPAGVLHDDIHNIRAIAVESLDLLDTLGWPKNEDTTLTPKRRAG